MKKSLLIWMMVLCAIYFTMRPASASNGGNLNTLCAGVSKLLNSYSKKCPKSVSKSPTASPAQGKTDSTVIADCLVEITRFHSADDITQTEQEARLAMRSPPVEQSDICTQAPEHVDILIRRIELTIEYFSTLRNLKFAITVFAARSVQAQIGFILKQFKDGTGVTTVPSNLVNRLKALEIKCKNVALKLELENSRNWNIADQTTASTYYWKTPRKTGWMAWNVLGSRETQTAPQLRNLTDYYRNHDANDECHTRMTRDCDLSQKCADILLDYSAEITTLDHNILYFKTAMRLECVNEVQFMDKFPNYDWKSVLQQHCAKTWDEAIAISNANYPSGYKAIFLAHAASCAAVGFPNFLRADWIAGVVSWMNLSGNGCIPIDTKDGTGDLELGYDILDMNGQLCTTYETSLGLELLGMHLRYLFETCSFLV